jgi:hypothetical protein
MGGNGDLVRYGKSSEGEQAERRQWRAAVAAAEAMLREVK